MVLFVKKKRYDINLDITELMISRESHHMIVRVDGCCHSLRNTEILPVLLTAGEMCVIMAVTASRTGRQHGPPVAARRFPARIIGLGKEDGT
jgi:hypothetical protein